MPTTIPVKQPENNYGTCHRGAPAAKRALKNLENHQLTTTLCVDLSFWFFAVSDGFFIGDVGFFVGPADFFWTSTGLSNNVTIFFATSAPMVCLNSRLGCTCNKLQNNVGYFECWLQFRIWILVRDHATIQ
jgi:hypothetical protein